MANRHNQLRVSLEERTENFKKFYEVCFYSLDGLPHVRFPNIFRQFFPRFRSLSKTLSHFSEHLLLLLNANTNFQDCSF